MKSGYIKGKPIHFETWWWNKDVDMAVCRFGKHGKASGPSGVAIQLFEAGEDKFLKSLTNKFNDI